MFASVVTLNGGLDGSLSGGLGGGLDDGNNKRH